ncbi:MAG TPA: hypothetical protein PKD51_12530 [Saprospiraceae bacterium]|nr:hypothetical protein [Saprospiraceae bacterium]
MKTKSTSNNLLINALIVILLVSTSFRLSAQNQDTTNLRDFKIVIENTDTGIKMQSLKGCAWIDLSFSLKNYNTQYIDEYGMTEKEKLSDQNDTTLANFLITLTKTKEGITLQGIEGTAWKELKFSFAKNGRQVIDQFGMVE